MLATGSPFMVYNMIAIVCMLLGNAAGTAWDLLVEVGKLKAGQAKGDGRA